MATRFPEFESETFLNWLKLGLAIRYTKEGIEPLVAEDAKQFQEEVLKQVYTQKGVRRGTTCTSCYTENVVPCFTRDYCKKGKGGMCHVHSPPGKQHKACPSKICDMFFKKIRIEHRFPTPSWKNSNAERWCTEPVELAKCFMPKDGYAHVTTFDEVDFNGVLNVIINNKRMGTKFSDDLTPRDNIVTKAREIGRAFRHSPDLAVDKATFQASVDILVNMLSNVNCQPHQQTAKNQIDLLLQLKDEDIKICLSNTSEVIEDFLRTTDEEDASRKMQEAQVAFLRDVANAAKSIDQITTKGLQEIIKSLNSAKTEIKNVARREKNVVIKAGTNLKRKHKQLLTQHSKRIRIEKEKAVADIRSSASSSRAFGIKISESEDYPNLKNELKRDLLNLYRERHSTLPLSPLIEKNKAPLIEFFVCPKITIVDINKGVFDNKEYPTYSGVDNLKDIFFNKNDQEMYRNVCITSPPGTGKTSFAKYVALLWCQSHFRDQTIDLHFESKESQSDLECIRNFEFLFFLSLRDAQQECEQDVMIKTMLIRQLDQENCYTDDFLQAVLHNERCLVLMDGLDEWRHPKAANKACNLDKSDFPHTKARLKCTTLSTSRPWTLHGIRQCSIHFDQRFEIQGLGKESSKKLVSKVISYLNNKNKNAKISEKQFLEMITSKGLQKFASNPVILMQLLCLCYDGTDPGESQCEIYRNMLKLLFRRAERKKTTSKETPHNKLLMCKKDEKLLLSLGKLAFATLFAEIGESIYVFDGSIASKYLQESEKKKCLEVGILTQSEEYGKIATENIKVSFLHRTFQEYFAALYLHSKQLTKEMAENICGTNASVMSILQLETFMIFLSGFAPAIANELTKHLSEIVGKDEVTHNYRTNIGTLFLENRPNIDNFCSMTTKCVKEGISNKHDNLGIFHIEDIVIDDQCTDEQYVFALKYLIGTNASNIKSLSINLLQKVDDKTKNRTLQKLNLLVLCNLEKIFVFGDIPRVLLQCLLGLSRHTMKSLELWNMPLFLEDVSIFAEMTKIQNLSFLGLSMSHVVFEEMMSMFEQRSKLTSVFLNSIECSDHHEECPGKALTFSDNSLMSLLVLDKVNLSSISLNAKNLKWCVVEWLPIPKTLTSLLHCLRNATSLERLDCDSPVCPEDTKELVATISTLANLKYLRLRNVIVRDLAFDISKLRSLKIVIFYNVTTECSVCENVIAQLLEIGSSVEVLMERCIVEPAKKYQKLIGQLQSSGKIEVLMEIKHGKAYGFELLRFKTIVSNTTTDLAPNQNWPLNQDWEKCFCEDASTVRNLVDELLTNHKFPDQRTLDRLCEQFGRKNELVTTVCDELCVYIQSKSSKIVLIVPSYTTISDDCNKIVFVIYTNDSLSRTELNEIEYSKTIRTTGEYSLARKIIAQDSHVEKHQLAPQEEEILKKCINKHALSLLAKHKMLSIILQSPVRSTQDGLKIEREPCIALYVRTKYYVPIDEELFETNYDGIPVDVREGEFMTHPGTPSNAGDEDVLKMGCQIGSVYGSNAGTLGGFIEHPQYGLCGFTCAHVLLTPPLMNNLKQCGMINWPDFSPRETVTQPAGSSNDIGRLVQAVHTVGIDGQSGVEVALFQIEKRHPNAGKFHGHDSKRFDSGRTHGFSRIENVQVVKFGYMTQQTVGKFILSEPSITVRALNHKVGVGNDLLTLNNQLEVKSLDDEHFSKEGDSGSLVFMKGSEEDGEYTCIGMVEGGTTYGTTIVTPIISILEAFKVPSLKNFETTKLSAELKDARTDMRSLQSQINQFDKKIQGVEDSIIQEINKMAARLPNQ